MTLPTMTRAALFHNVQLRGYRYVLALTAIAIWLVAGSTQAPAAEPWPTRPVTVLCPFAAGTSTDTLMRLVNASLSQRFGQNFIVENRPGATGNIAAGVVARAEPDGYTLFIGTGGPIVNNKFMYKNLDFDPDRAFAPIALLASSPLIIVGSPQLPVKTLSELVAYGKAHRGPLNAGTVGVGSQAHITVELLNKAAGIAIGHVPYRITSQALPMGRRATCSFRSNTFRPSCRTCSRECSPALPSPAPSAWPSCRMCRPSPSKAIPVSKPTAGPRFRTSRDAGRHRRQDQPRRERYFGSDTGKDQLAKISMTPLGGTPDSSPIISPPRMPSGDRSSATPTSSCNIRFSTMMTERLPRNSCDTHLHIFGDAGAYRPPATRSMRRRRIAPLPQRRCCSTPWASSARSSCSRRFTAPITG